MAVAYKDGTFGETQPINDAFGEFKKALNEQTARAFLVGTPQEIEAMKQEDDSKTSIEKLEKEMSVKGKIRYSHKESDCIIRIVNDDLLECEFKEPQRAITPGQAVVFYQDDYIIGGGTIIKQLN